MYLGWISIERSHKVINVIGHCPISPVPEVLVVLTSATLEVQGQID